jgi:hypothetical protein
MAGLLTSLHSTGQMLIVKTPLGACSKCFAPLGQLAPRLSDIPVTVVFSSSHRADSADIEQSYGFSGLGYTCLFHDSLYQILPGNESGYIYALSTGGEIVMRKPLVGLDETSKQALTQFYKRAVPFDYKANAQIRIKSGIQQLNYYELGKLRFIDSSHDQTIRASEKLADVSRKRSPIGRQHSNGAFQDIVATDGPNMNAKMAGYDLGSTDSRTYTFRYNVVFTMGKDTGIYPEQAVAHMNPDSTMDAFPFLVPKEYERSIVYNGTNFIGIGRDSVCIITLKNGALLSPDSLDWFLGIFVRDSMSMNYTFKSWMPFKVPKIYNRLGYSGLSLNVFEYPYLMLPSSNMAYNLATRTQTNLQIPECDDLNSQSEAKRIDQQYRNLSVSYSKANGRLYVVANVHGKLHLQMFDVQSGVRKYSKPLAQYAATISEDKFAEVDANAHTVYYTTSAGKIVGIPLMLFEI